MEEIEKQTRDYLKLFPRLESLPSRFFRFKTYPPLWYSLLEEVDR